jgi:hypothetical protein
LCAAGGVPDRRHHNPLAIWIHARTNFMLSARAPADVRELFAGEVAPALRA